MQIKIKKNVYVSHNATDSMKEYFKVNSGKWVDVETKHLFNNQYNTEYVRVHDSQIDEVRDDARIGKGKCCYCGALIEQGNECNKHDECKEYGIEWFTEKNTFFIANPKGADIVKQVSMEDEKKFGTFKLEQLAPPLNYYRLSNARERYTFRFDVKTQMFWMGDTIGNTRKRNLGIKAKSFKVEELKAYLTEQQTK